MPDARTEGERISQRYGVCHGGAYRRESPTQVSTFTASWLLQSALKKDIDTALAAAKNAVIAAKDAEIERLRGALHRANNGLKRTCDPSVDSLVDDIAAVLKEPTNDQP